MNERDRPLSKDGTIIGMYLGWVIPDTNKWEALLKLTRSSLGYHLNPTNFCIDLSKKYKGIPKILGISDLEEEYISSDIPSIFDPRIPVEREDVGETCKFLGLDFPGIDSFAFMTRTGGKIHGDPFSLCPIISPSPNNNYEFYCCISTSKELSEHWDSFTLNSKARYHNGSLSIQLSGNNIDCPANLPSFFDRLDGSIDKIDLLNISAPSVFGVRIFAKVTLTSSNPYSSSTFSLLGDLARR